MKHQLLKLARERVRAFLLLLLRLFGTRLLTKSETIDYLKPAEKSHYPVNQLPLPDVVDVAKPDRQLFRQQLAVTLPSYVWTVDARQTPASLLRCGNLNVNGRVLCADYHNHFLLRDQFKPARRTPVRTETLIAPLGHYQDGIMFGGYYDFLYLLAAKLCRMEKALPAGTFAESVIAYPLYNTSYEQELLTYMGFRSDRVLHSQRHNIRFNQCFVGSNGHWYYPNLADVMALRERLYPLIEQKEKKRDRIYISRDCRRRIVNEDELVGLLQRYDFRIIEDKPRTLGEQLSIYNQASLVMGPHGASFSNLIWCESGTQLFELFSPSYAPDFFLYLAKLMGLNYAATYQECVPARGQISLEDDIRVSLSDIERSLNRLLENEQRH